MEGGICAWVRAGFHLNLLCMPVLPGSHSPCDAEQGHALLRGEPEQGKPPSAGMLLGEEGFLQRSSLQAFSWQGEHLLEIKAKMPHAVSTLKRLLC